MTSPTGAASPFQLPPERVKGHVHLKGRVWYLTYPCESRTSVARVPRKTIRLGAASELDRAAARKLADEIKRSDGAVPPAPDPTLARFVQERFMPEFVSTRKASGQAHYVSILRRYVLPSLGSKRLKDIGYTDLQQLVREKEAEGYMPQTLRHIKNCCSAVLRHAIERTGDYVGPNPARGVLLPEMRRKPKHSLTWEQAQALLPELSTPVREMARMAILCGLNVAEMTALRWSRTNLTHNDWMQVDGEPLEPGCAAIVENLYKRKFGTVKHGARNRIVPLPRSVMAELMALKTRGHHTEPNDLVFCSRTGHHVTISNLTNRVLKPAAVRVGVPWLSWHQLRHSHATLAQEVGLPLLETMANMGHTNPTQTIHYSHAALELRRKSIEELSALIDSGVKKDTVKKDKGK